MCYQVALGWLSRGLTHRIGGRQGLGDTPDGNDAALSCPGTVLNIIDNPANPWLKESTTMAPEPKQELLKRIPPITELLKTPAAGPLAEDPPAVAGDGLPAGRRRRASERGARGLGQPTAGPSK